MEEHLLIKRTVHDQYPVLVQYTATEYSQSLDKVLMELYHWGVNHRKHVLGV